MRRIATATKSVDLFGAGKHGFTEGDAQAGVAPTDLSGNWFNDVQEEIAGVLEKAGKTLDSTVRLFDAIFDGVRLWKPELTLAGVATYIFQRTHVLGSDGDKYGELTSTVALRQAAPSTTHSINSAAMPNGFYEGVATVSITRDGSAAIYYGRRWEVAFTVTSGVASGLTATAQGTGHDTSGGLFTIAFAGNSGAFRLNVTIGASVGNTFNIACTYKLTRVQSTAFGA
jgi:hypothetical protein